MSASYLFLCNVFAVWDYACRVSFIEGTAMNLLENKQGHIVGVLYKEKETGRVKVKKSHFTITAVCSIAIVSQAIRADLTIVADGCFSKFRKGLVNAAVAVSSHFAGLILTNCPQYKTGFAEIVLPVGGSGPILVYQISSTCTRVLVDIRGKMPSDTKEYMMDSVAPELPGQPLATVLPLAFSQLPSYYSCTLITTQFHGLM